MERPHARLRTLGVAVLVAGALLVIGRQITIHGWYGANGAYRAQVDAFLEGRLALSHAPEAIQHDLAWTGSGVQQVWGLGAPMWMTPFEVVGRVIGLTPFPDRIAMLLWLALAIYVTARAWREPGEPWWIRVGCIGLTALLPAFVTMLRGRLGIYEEAAIYAYGAGIVLLGGLVCFARRPSAARYFALVTAAGLTGFVRPTVWFYGLATVIVASVLWRRPRDLAIGAALFVAGGGALYATNAMRFGSGMEFGHRLNLEALPGNLYATRFSYPFERIGTLAAAEELAGSLFDSPERHPRTTFYGKRLHRGQASLPRWREYYFTTFSWPYVPLLVLGIVLGVRAWRRRDGPDPRRARWLLAWAIIGGAPLAVFYLRSPSVSSRYQLDLAPAFAALLVIGWRWAATRKHAPIIAGIAAGAWFVNVGFARVSSPRLGAEAIGRTAAADTAYAISRAALHEHPLPSAYELDDPWLPGDTDVLESYTRCVDETGTPIDPDAPPIAGDACVHGEREPDEEQWLEWTTVVRDEPAAVCEPPRAICEPEPAAADGEIEARIIPPPSLYLNMFRWDLATGEVPPATFAWIADPRFVELDLGGPPGTDWTHAVRVAVGPVHLRLASIADTGHGVRLRFEAGAPLPGGLQVAFLAFGSDLAIDQVHTAFSVTRIRWR